MTLERKKSDQLVKGNLLGFLLGAFLALPCLAQTPPVAPPPQTQAAQSMLSINSDLVLLPVTVTDSQGRFVPGLSQNDFRVYEDGRQQQISVFESKDIPVTVGLMIDQSGSMFPKLPEVVAAALAFAKSSNPEDQIFVVNFNEVVTLGLPSGVAFTSDSRQLQAALASGSAHGETALYDAIAIALDHLELGNRNKKALVVISDGGDNASAHRFPQVLAMAQHSRALIYAIGIFDETDEYRKPKVLKQLAKATGGRAYFPESTQDVEGIGQQIARDLREQYMVGYIPTNGKLDGTYRRVQVTVNMHGRGKLVARTRDGYFARTARPASAAGDNRKAL